MLKLTRRHGSPYWYVRGVVAGRRIDESTKITDRALAESYRSKREWELTHASVFGQSGRASFAEACAGYLETATDTRFIGRLLDHFGAAPLRSINQAEVERAAKALYPNAGPATINRQLYTPLSAILTHAAARGLCDAISFARPRQPPGRIRWITPTEAERLIACAGPRVRTLIIFLLYTGARVSEAARLEWRDIDLTAAHVVLHETKNGEPRGVPLHPRLVATLANLTHRTGRVFLTHHRRGYRDLKGEGGHAKTAFRNAVKKAGLAPLTPHDLRHTWATWHYQANRDFTALKKLGGWKTDAMVLRYAHTNTSEFAASINRMPGGNAAGTEG